MTNLADDRLFGDYVPPIPRFPLLVRLSDYNTAADRVYRKMLRAKGINVVPKWRRKLLPNWPPLGWSNDVVPGDDSLNAIGQWFDCVIPAIGLLEKQQESDDLLLRGQDGTDFVRDAHLLVKVLKLKGWTTAFSEPPGRISFRDARIDLEKLRDWLAMGAAQSKSKDSASVAAKPLRVQPATNANEWPRKDGWDFREGEAGFQGFKFSIQGIPWRLLKKLAEKVGTPVSEATLLDVMNSDDGNAGEGSLRSQLTRTRDILRAAFELSSDLDPLPNVERGRDAAWKLDEKVFPPVSEIQRWLNGR